MKQHSRLKSDLHQEDQQLTSGEERQVTEKGRTFETVEELLREDAAQTEVPLTIAERLQQSLEKLPNQPARSWWRKFLGS